MKAWVRKKLNLPPRDKSNKVIGVLRSLKVDAEMKKSVDAVIEQLRAACAKTGKEDGR